MREMMNLALRLLIISAVAALALAATNMVTKGPIEELAEETANAARLEVIDAENFEEVEKFTELPGWDGSITGVTKIYKAMSGGQMIGATVELAAKGYGGDIIMTVGVTADGKISGIAINSHSETASLGSRVTESGFRDQFPGKDASQPIAATSAGSDNDIQAISGASISSRAVADGVTSAGKAALIAMGGE